jgi:hypothetical protein
MREGEFSNSVSTISTIEGSFSSLLAPGNHQDKGELHKTILNRKANRSHDICSERWMKQFYMAESAYWLLDQIGSRSLD